MVMIALIIIFGMSRYILEPAFNAKANFDTAQDTIEYIKDEEFYKASFAGVTTQQTVLSTTKSTTLTTTTSTTTTTSSTQKPSPTSTTSTPTTTAPTTTYTTLSITNTITSTTNIITNTFSSFPVASYGVYIYYVNANPGGKVVLTNSWNADVLINGWYLAKKGKVIYRFTNVLVPANGYVIVSFTEGTDSGNTYYAGDIRVNPHNDELVLYNMNNVDVHSCSWKEKGWGVIYVNYELEGSGGKGKYAKEWWKTNGVITCYEEDEYDEDED